VSNGLQKKENVLLEPKYKKERPKCPFYGFFFLRLGKSTHGKMMDQDGNQCPFLGPYKPCLMIISGKDPNWNRCPIKMNGSNEEIIQKFKKTSVFFPKEFCPPGKPPSSWEGISMEDWMDYIMGKDSQ